MNQPDENWGLERFCSEADAKALAADLKDLQAHIGSIRSDLASLTPANVPGIHLPEASSELGAVVSTTETAANRILDACQIFEAAIGQNSAADPQLAVALSTIYEACSFQDLTGQRIAKVRKILGMVEEKLGSVFEKLGISSEPGAEPEPQDQAAAERALMNGPAMPGQGVDQADIDALFD